jgi:hypothetical protein
VAGKWSGSLADVGDVSLTPLSVRDRDVGDASGNGVVGADV